MAAAIRTAGFGVNVDHSDFAALLNGGNGQTKGDVDRRDQKVQRDLVGRFSEDDAASTDGSSLDAAPAVRPRR